MMKRHLAAVIAAGALWAAPVFGASVLAEEIRNPELPSETWEYLSDSLYPDVEIADGGDFIHLGAPYRAQDAGVVPIDIKVTPPLGRVVERLTLVIDENPSPVVVEMDVGSIMGREVRLSTRVRIDMYSNVRAIVELDDGGLWQTARYVKASGGCSAPALKDMDSAIAEAGAMRMRLFEPAAEETEVAEHEAQLMIRHPNYSGMQMNQVTMLTIPAFFIDHVEVKLGEETVFTVQGGISLSENPSLRFGYVPNGADAFTVKATDVDGNVYEGEFPIEPIT